MKRNGLIARALLCADAALTVVFYVAGAVVGAL
jgi:hypothetical protein